MSSVPRIPLPEECRTPWGFLNPYAAYQPEIAQAQRRFAAAARQRLVDAVTRELARLKNAELVDCRI
jgi:hypothetical protein